MKVDILKYKIRRKINRFIDEIFYCTKFTRFYKPISADLLILDDFFPCPLSYFRFIEFNEYLQKYNSIVLTTGKSLPVAQVYSGISKYINAHPRRNQIKIFRMNRFVNVKLAVLVFQHNTEIFLDFLERNKIPFVFTLYPGGNFKLNDIQGDMGLSRIFNSKYFRKVIVTQKITNDYLIGKSLCRKDQIEFIYGSPFNIDRIKDNLVKRTNEYINICFVAAKYHPTGIDKGYDIFIDVAKQLCSISSKFKFHVIGGFNSNDINITEISENLNFYGYLDMIVLKKLFENMDFIISPNRSNILSNGSFDGFPTASVAEAGLKGVIMVLSDDLNQNIYMKNNIDCIFVNHNPNEITDKILKVVNNEDLKKNLSKNGQQLLYNVFSKDIQMKKRFEIIDKCMSDL
jgi:glycosyltransferase involved in cell wall biosynthesis